jgi:hypothetical protein
MLNAPTALHDCQQWRKDAERLRETAQTLLVYARAWVVRGKARAVSRAWVAAIPEEPPA